MARKTPLTSLSQISEINLTPLMDLTFILLITFIITFPLIEQGISVDLPVGEASELSAARAQTITLDAEGHLYLDDIQIGIEALERRMAEIARAQPDINVMIRADQGIRYGSVVEILRVLRSAEIRNMALVTQAETEPAS